MKIILIGKSASGKTYAKKLLQTHFKPSISVTTRQPRQGNENDYTFTTTDIFKALTDNNLMLEWELFNGNYYGTSKFDWNNRELFILTPSAINKLDCTNCVIIYFNPPQQQLLERMALRKQTKERIQERINADNLVFKNFNKYNIEITNPNFTLNDLLTAIQEFTHCDLK